MAEELCQCSDCQRFYKEHDRLIREFPTFKQQQELNWASIQSFRTLCTKVTDELQKELSERESNEDISPEDKHISDAEKRGDTEQAMGWFADSMRLRDVINLVTSIEIPLPDSPDSLDENDELLDGPTILPK